MTFISFTFKIFNVGYLLASPLKFHSLTRPQHIDYAL
jgi:hypothetical protein